MLLLLLLLAAKIRVRTEAPATDPTSQASSKDPTHPIYSTDTDSKDRKRPDASTPSSDRSRRDDRDRDRERGRDRSDRDDRHRRRSSSPDNHRRRDSPPRRRGPPPGELRPDEALKRPSESVDEVRTRVHPALPPIILPPLPHTLCKRYNSVRRSWHARQPTSRWKKPGNGFWPARRRAPSGRCQRLTTTRQLCGKQTTSIKGMKLDHNMMY